jgi:hypothetical protein
MTLERCCRRSMQRMKLEAGILGRGRSAMPFWPAVRPFHLARQLELGCGGGASVREPATPGRN